MSGSFADLKVRMLSAGVLVVVGIGAIWLGGIAFLALMTIAAALMVGELMRMLAPNASPILLIFMGILAAIGTLWPALNHSIAAQASVLAAPVIGALVIRQDRVLFLAYGLAILLAVSMLILLRQTTGLPVILWLILVVVASDIGGYFCGRIIGGPKIFPKISPKKTWSGTLGGWALAALVGFGFVWTDLAGYGLIWLSILVSVAAQIGDMAESAVKRHAGVKDSSNLIPGHGGLLDRFDALIGAALLVLAIGLLTNLPSGLM